MTSSEESAAVKAPTKYTIREQIYKDFDAKGLSKLPYPVRAHIPKFSTAHEAAARIAELPEYQNATTVLTKTGITLESIRVKVLQDKKKLLVPVPSPSTTGTLFSVNPPEEEDENALKKYVSGTTLPDNSKTVPADDSLHVDIIVLGSVVVDRKGRRIGSGRDYSDLECAVMVQKGMITERTVVVTLVHDAQVVDSLPEELFGEHDVRVNIILTPTEIIRIDGQVAKPQGIMWNLLTKRMLRSVPVLKEMYEKEKEAGRECELMVEDRRVRNYRTPRRQVYRRRRPSGDKGAENADGVDGVQSGDQPQRRPHWKSRRRAPRSEGEEEKAVEEGEAEKAEKSEEVTQNGESSRPAKSNRARGPPRANSQSQEGGGRPRRPPFRRRFPIDFSLRVSNIASDVRVRDLKNALAECHVKPAEIKWQGQDGFAVLHFARERRQETDSPISMDGVITSLRNLNVSAIGGETIAVEPYTRVTRIEVTNEVTAV